MGFFHCVLVFTVVLVINCDPDCQKKIKNVNVAPKDFDSGISRDSKVNMVKVELQFDPSLLKELVVGNKTFRPTCDYNVSERDLEIAREELLETEEKRKTSLKELKTMLTNDRRFRYRMDDDYLLRFLRFMKFDLSKTYGLIQHFYTMRNEYPDLFTMPPDVELKLEGNFINMMPYTQDDGEIVVIYRVGYWNPSAVSVLDLCRMCSYVSDVTSMNPHAQINGLIDIFDLSSATAEQIAVLFYPPSLTFWTKFVQEMFPWRVKKVIIMNCNPLLHASISVLRYVLKKEIADRIVLICSLNELHKHVNPAILPKEYGGNLDDEECYSYMKKIVLSNKKYLGYENSFIGNRKG